MNSRLLLPEPSTPRGLQLLVAQLRRQLAHVSAAAAAAEAFQTAERERLEREIAFLKKEVAARSGMNAMRDRSTPRRAAPRRAAPRRAAPRRTAPHRTVLYCAVAVLSPFRTCLLERLRCSLRCSLRLVSAAACAVASLHCTKWTERRCAFSGGGLRARSAGGNRTR